MGQYLRDHHSGFHKDQILAYALVGGLENSVIPRRNELIPFIQTITNLIVVAIENHHIAGEKIRQAAMRRDLDLAAQMQSMLFPIALPDNARYQLCATYLPHQEVGGDYYDFLPLNEDEFIFCMADVSGKGIPPHCSVPISRLTSTRTFPLFQAWSIWSMC